MRVARPIVLNAESRTSTGAASAWAHSAHAVRSRIVSPAADGQQHKRISEELKVNPRG